MNTSARSQFTNSPKRKGVKSGLSLTENDEKVLGKALQRRQAALPKDHFQTKKYKTHNSAWTPVVHKASNEQIFQERCDLVCHWFDLWNGRQRKTFLDTILNKCDRSQLLFTHRWFQERAVIQHLDFTTVLPRFLSLYIFSFLDPRSLSRASQVSWHWKALTEQDSLWLPKCLKLGWYLPYLPSDLENGAWKKHYVMCTTNIDLVPVNDEFYNSVNLLVQQESEAAKRKKAKKRAKLSHSASKVMLDNRPSWVVCGSVDDIRVGSSAYLNGLNTNETKHDSSNLMFHNKWGQLKRDAMPTSVSLLTGHGLGSRSRKADHRLHKTNMGMSLDSALSASKGFHDNSVDFPPPNYLHAGEARMKELVETKWKSPYQPSPQLPSRPNIASGLLYPSSAPGQMTASSACREPHSHPRVVFISSRAPAAELLLDAVVFGVIPIVYEFEGTTIYTLLRKLEKALNGRTAECIGLVTEQMEPGEIRVTQYSCFTISDMKSSPFQQFFKNLASSVLPAAEGGHIDFFCPIASSEQGEDILFHLEKMTEMTFTSPSSLVTGYNYLLSDWHGFSSPGLSAPLLYFVQLKLQLWINLANHVADITKSVREKVKQNLSVQSHGIVANVTGEILFDVLGTVNLSALRSLWPVLIEGLCNLKWNKQEDPLKVVGDFLLSKAEAYRTKEYSKETGDDEEASESEEVKKGEEKQEKDDLPKEFFGNKENMKLKSQSNSMTFTRKPMGPMQSAFLPSHSRSLKVTANKTTSRLTPSEYSDLPDKRSMVARELVATEIWYLKCLAVTQDFYVVPLKKAVSSNRAILPINHIYTIFSDVVILLELGKKLLKELKSRLQEWDSNQCLGDVFVKFSPQLKAYMHYFKNYVMILDTLDKCIANYPPFRAFLKTVENTPQSLMMSLHELLMLPTERIEAYTALLSWFKQHTPLDHPDRADLTQSIEVIKDLQKVIRETKLRIDRDKKLIEIQEKVHGCPVLLESNRYYLTQADVSVMKPTKESSSHERRKYVHTEDFGLFLFNDALVITKITKAHYPFQRAVEQSYTFLRSIALTHLKVWDLPDTRYVKNVLMVEGSGTCWYVVLGTYDLKFDFLTTLLGAIDTAIADNLNL